jgi:hypothetical protein
MAYIQPYWMAKRHMAFISLLADASLHQVD